MQEILIRDGSKIITIPSCWQDISLRKYMEIVKIKEDESEEFKSLYVIEAYTGIPLIELKRMKLTELHVIVDVLKFITTEIPEEPIENFIINGETYHVTQSLLLEEAQDYFAVEAILQEAEQDPFKALPKLLAVVCKKPQESLDQIDIIKRSELFLDGLNIVQANALRVFFYHCGLLFNLNFQLYSNRDQIIQAKVEECKNTVEQLDGTGYYGRWLKKTLQKLIRYYEQDWKNFSSGTQSKSRELSWKTTFKRSLKRNRVKK
jgi:hypothetical protein